MSRKRYTPPYRTRHQVGLITELRETVKPSMAPSSMTEDEASHLYNPELPGDGSMKWVLVAFCAVVLLLIILTIIYFS